MDETVISAELHPAEGVVLNATPPEIVFPAFWCAMTDSVEREVNVTMFYPEGLLTGIELKSQAFFRDVTDSPIHGEVRRVYFSTTRIVQNETEHSTTSSASRDAPGLQAYAVLLGTLAFAAYRRR